MEVGELRKLFDEDWYLEQNPDVADAGVDPFQHFLKHGWTEGRDPQEFFDTSYYLECNRDVAAAGVNPLQHYLQHGWREGRDPHPKFMTRFYLKEHRDVAQADINPLVHFTLHGRLEGRRAHPSAEFRAPDWPSDIEGDRLKVLFVDGEPGSLTSFFRVVQPASALRRAGALVAIVPQGRLPIDLRADTYDVLVLARCNLTGAIGGLIRQAKRCNLPVIFDCDDLLFAELNAEDFDVFETGTDIQRTALRTKIEDARAIIRQADHFIGPTEYLAKDARAIRNIKTAHVVRNHPDPRFLHVAKKHDIPRAPGRPFRIYYFSGSASHNRDFKVVERALADWLSRADVSAELNIVGKLDIGLDSPLAHLPAGKVRQHPYIAPADYYSELPRHLLNADVNIAPLDLSRRYAHGKSELKFFDAAAFGVPTVASRSETFAAAIEQERTGMLCDDDRDWIEAVDRLYRDASLYTAISENARTHVFEVYSQENLVAALARAFAEIVPGRTLNAANLAPGVPIGAPSPIVSRLAPAQYLEPFSSGSRARRPWKCWDEYARRAALDSTLIRDPLLEEDLRIVAMMDFDKRERAARFADRPQTKTVSVVMPTKDRPHLMWCAVESVLAQSYRNFELIVVDDGGDSGATERLVQRFGDPRIRYVRLDQTMGNAAARNAGLAAARGVFVAYLDDDDAWDPDFLLISVGELTDSGAALCYSAQVVWRGFDRVTQVGEGFRFIRFAPFNRSLLENANYISMISCMHRRELLDQAGHFDETLSRFVDWDFFLRMTEVAPPLVIPCILSHYFTERAAANVSNQITWDDARHAVVKRLEERACWSRWLSTAPGGGLFATGVGAKTRAERASRIWIAAKGVRTKIIIPSHEAREELALCLRSIEENTDGDFSVVVVDNRSCADTKAWIRTLCSTFEFVDVVDFDAQAGFTFAVNAGLATLEARDECVLFLNNDTVATPGWLPELIALFANYRDCGMAVPRQVLPPHHPIARAHVPVSDVTRETDVNLSQHHDNIVDPAFNTKDGVYELTYAPLFCSLMKVSDVQAIGRLDAENGPHYRSDWILCDAVRRKLNKRILYTPHSKVYHFQGISTQEASG